MNDMEAPKIYKEINSDNYLINSYRHLIKSKAFHFIFILIEILIIIIQELEIFIRGFNSEKQKKGLNYISFIANKFDKLKLSIKIMLLLFQVIIIDILYFFLKKKNFKKENIYINIISNILEIFCFRTYMLIFLNIFYTLPHIYYFISLFVLFPHMYIIFNNFYYNHLYNFVPKFINYPFDEFSSLFDIILLFIKICISIAGNSKNFSLIKFCFLILLLWQIFFSLNFAYKLINKSYLFMKNTFLNKTRLGFFLVNTFILIFALLFGRNEIVSILFLFACLGLFFIVMVYMYLIYNPFHFIKIKGEASKEIIFFYLFSLSYSQNLEFLFENKLKEHLEKCGLCSLCKKYLKYLENNQSIEIEDNENARLINKERNNNIYKNKLNDLFHVVNDGENKYFELIKKVIIDYKRKGKESFNNNSYYYINLSFLIYSDYKKNNITLSLNEKILLDLLNKQNKLIDNNESQIRQILFCNLFINLGNKILNQLREILVCDQNIKKAKKLLDLSILLKEMKNPKYENYLLTHKQDNISNSRNLLMTCSIVYEEIFNTVTSKSQMPLRENIQSLEDIFYNNSKKMERIISLIVDLSNNKCKIVRIGKDLYSFNFSNLFDLFPLVFKEYQINLFFSNISEYFDKNINKEQIKNININNNISNKSTKKFNNERKKSVNFIKEIYNNNKKKKKIEYVEMKLIICQSISSKIYYKLITLKLVPLFNSNYNSYFILFDGIFKLHKNILITLQDFEEDNNPDEKIISVSEPELDWPEIYSMNFEKYQKFQYNKGFIIQKIYKFNLDNKLYCLYSFEDQKEILKISKKKINSPEKANIIDCDFEEDEEEDKKNTQNIQNVINKNIKIEKIIDDNISAISQQVNSSYNNGISGFGIRSKKKENIYEYNSLKIIRKIIYIFIPIILIFLIIEFIYLTTLRNRTISELDLFIGFRKFYSLYFQIFVSIIGFSNVRIFYSVQPFIYLYIYNNYLVNQIDMDYRIYIQEQAKILVEDILKQREYLVNIHKNIGNSKYNEIFCQYIDYFRISQNSTNGLIRYNLIKGKIEFSEALLIMLNSFQSITNNTSSIIIFFINKLEKDPFTLLNSEYNFNMEIDQFQKGFYEMILNFKNYRRQLNNINNDLNSLLLDSNYKKLKVAIILLINLDNLFMLLISSLLYAYLFFFENILMKILNFINFTINIKNDKFNFSQTFSQKIDNLENLLKIYEEDPIKCVKNINKIYNKYQQYLTVRNKNNINQMNKRGYKKIINNENKKSEMQNIPKNQRIVSKKDIRNLHLINNYLISLFAILAIFLGFYSGMMIMWMNHFNRQRGLYIIINKNFKLESTLYDAINAYNMMIFQNYTLDEVSETIFDLPKTHEEAELLNNFYSDLEYAFIIKEKNELRKMFLVIKKKMNVTCDFLYNSNKIINKTIEKLENNYGIINSRENLIKVCKNERFFESNKIISIFEYHFQNIKNAILSLKDFSFRGLASHITSEIYAGKINIFFNCILIYVLDFVFNKPNNISINIFYSSLKKYLIITEVIFIVLDFLIISIILFSYIANIKNYCNQIVLLKTVFKIKEINEK